MQGWCDYVVQDSWCSSKTREQLMVARKVNKEQLEVINKLGDNQDRLQGAHNQLIAY